MSDSSKVLNGGVGQARPGLGPWLLWVPVVGLLVVLYWRVGFTLYNNWTLTDSYYSHGFLIPPISLVLVWLRRKDLLATPVNPTWMGFILMAGACGLLILADFLSFTVFAQLSLLPMVVGFVLAAWGPRHFAIVWFPVLLLIFMIPIPPSLTQSIILETKLAATEGAVQLARLCSLSMIRDGSYVYFGEDRLLVGEVCGGLRSLIALLSFGTLMAYISKTRGWAKVLILVLSGPIAIVSNTVRIFALCVIGYFWGSEAATGFVHDASGILIFAVAFAILFALETVLRKVAPRKKESTAS